MLTKMTEEDWVLVREVMSAACGGGTRGGTTASFSKLALFHGPQHYVEPEIWGWVESMPESIAATSVFPPFEIVCASGTCILGPR
jgi:hypothetical protein